MTIMAFINVSAYNLFCEVFIFKINFKKLTYIIQDILFQSGFFFFFNFELNYLFK